jgi:glycosyltransferase involved in cell wall biosynthesis
VNKPLLHVVIPAYGESPYLKETLASATRNLPLNVPITVLEDPSASTSVRETVANFLDRVEYKLNSERLGIAGNFNKAIEISTGTFTLLCGSDDLILGDLTKELKNLKDDDVAAVTSNSLIIDETGKKILPLPDLVKKIISPKSNKFFRYENKKFFNKLMFGDWLYFPAIAWNSEIIAKEKFNEEFHTAMDLDIFVRLIAKNYKIYHLPVCEFAYRRHSQSASSLYALEVGRFIEELTCHANAVKVAQEKKWRFSKLLAKLALTIRFHAILKALALAVRFKFSEAGKLMVISLTPVTSTRLQKSD